MTGAATGRTSGVSRRSLRMAVAGGSILTVLLLCAIAAPWVAPYDPAERVTTPFAKPSGAHWLGADDVGHDLLSQLIYGARVSLLIGVVAALAATVVGALVGVLAGYCRGSVDAILMRIVDVILTLPVLPLTIVIGVFMGPGLTTQILVISSVLWAGLARELRSQVLSLRERDYIHSLNSMGAPTWYVLRRHISRAVFPLIVPQFILAVKTAILLEASLAFLGLGDVTNASWGSMLALAQGRNAFLTDAWLWWILPPGLAIALTVLGFALIGNALEERSRPVLLRRKKIKRGDEGRAQSTADEPAGRADAPLVIENLTISYGEGRLGVRDVSLTLGVDEVVALVGESGSGKSTVAASTIGLLAPAAEIVGGAVRVCGQDVTRLPLRDLQALRGSRIALVPQEAMSALNPVRRIGDQLVESVLVHTSCTRDEARERSVDMLEKVGIDASRIDAYPHQLSGGMRQRVVIAMALVNEPAVLIADEPTSGLDVLMEEEILELLLTLRHSLGLSLLIVSHNLPIVERIADRIAVMKDGEIVEIGSVRAITTNPQHPYTRRLIDAVARLEPAAELQAAR
ncbi:dipeptide/oligopeptide/nickel ABC transporter permease/ATP-binding protein [Rhodococcus sp. ARC_M6]|uniref:dipeptide/oligopeptide/nickel ABC transporter permease/ATP-binding protein n=1 Tax=Rhodococcus sp. ARC_M6 TaxID=2928852 RepID=UPI001FB3109B|nr:dipeptide/oligopeptide/nickel ABC transporter permease/ATP-binding protein [Rhodococcus sp. ARC_M6]MCJ0907444.1 dipeptide/oligopeptide/nickel ABC transporter permease/ATP-binding protein [Rhodococcus sp. ARC_M6]